MPFKSNEAAIKLGCGIVVLVLNARKRLGATRSIPRSDKRRQNPYIRVASADGGFKTLAPAASDHGPELHAGDLVMCVPESFSEEIGRQHKQMRTGWQGMIQARINLTVSVDKG